MGYMLETQRPTHETCLIGYLARDAGFIQKARNGECMIINFDKRSITVHMGKKKVPVASIVLFSLLTDGRTEAQLRHI